jgi:DNA-binding CsgD family transcriptional regulator
MFGRHAELDRADGFLDAGGERFAALLVDGEAGIGKTTLWSEVVRRAEERGFRVLSARPAEAEAKFALSAVADLLERVPGEAFAALPGPQRRALDIALLRVEPAATPLDPRIVGTAVRSVLRELGGERPLLVAIDDLQWIDPTSATVLAVALRRLTDERLAWLCCRRPGEGGRVVLDARVRLESLTRLALGPLAVADLHRLVEERLGRPLSLPALRRLYDVAGGNPFHALEIARALDDGSGNGADRVPAPSSLTGHLSARISGVPEAARDALVAAAALSRPTAELVERAASADGLFAAQETGLIRVVGGRVAFAHPLHASAVYAAAAATRRRRLHRRLAELLRDPEQRARHLAAATSEADETVARALEDGAGLARSRGAWDSAADLLERARSLTPVDRPDEASRRGIAAAEHHVHAGDRSRGRALVEEVLGGRVPRALRADGLRLLAEIAISDDNVAEAVRLSGQALQHADEPAVAGVIELLLCYACKHRLDFSRGRTHAYRALDRARAAGDRALEAQALAHCAMMDFFSLRGLDWGKLERALELEDGAALVSLLRRPSTRVACLLACVGRHAEAREALTVLCVDARERGDESDLAFALLWLSWLETRCGRLAVAAAFADEAVSLAGLTGARSMHSWALAQRAYVHAQQGEAAEARRCGAEASAPGVHSGSLLTALWIAAGLGLIELAAGDTEAAWRVYEPVTAPLEAQGIGEPVPLFFLPDALETLVARGELDRSEALLDAFERRAREVDRAWALATAARCRALLLAARGDVAGAVVAIERALAHHERIDMPIELGRTLLARGVIERRARRRGRAKDAFERAAGIFEDAGARLWAARARTEIGRLGLRRSADGELTESERRVAELAAQGRTNREVAAALFISSKTVDANLTRVYRKLGIASRAQLGARMASGDDA